MAAACCAHGPSGSPDEQTDAEYPCMYVSLNLGGSFHLEVLVEALSYLRKVKGPSDKEGYLHMQLQDQRPAQRTGRGSPSWPARLIRGVRVTHILGTSWAAMETAFFSSTSPGVAGKDVF